MVPRFEECGTTHPFNGLFGRTILTIDPRNVQAVLSTNFKDFQLGDPRRQSFFPLLGNGIFTVCTLSSCIYFSSFAPKYFTPFQNLASIFCPTCFSLPSHEEVILTFKRE